MRFYFRGSVWYVLLQILCSTTHLFLQGTVINAYAKLKDILLRGKQGVALGSNVPYKNLSVLFSGAHMRVRIWNYGRGHPFYTNAR